MNREAAAVQSKWQIEEVQIELPQVSSATLEQFEAEFFTPACAAPE